MPENYKIYQNVIIPQCKINLKKRLVQSGFFDINEKIIPGTELKFIDRLTPTQRINKKRLANPQPVQGEAVFLGLLRAHYGHFLLDSLAWLWILNEFPLHNRTGIFQVTNHDTIENPEYIKLVMDAFGITTQNTLLTTKPLIVEKVIVPEAQYNPFEFRAKKAYKQVYNRIANHVFNNGIYDDIKNEGMYYLSRKKLPTDQKKYRPCVNESAIEEMMTKFGFDIIYPEHIPFERQIVMYTRAKCIVGFEGSALHNAVFMKPDTSVISIGSFRKKQEIHPAQAVCNFISGVKGFTIPFSGQLLKEETQEFEFDLKHLEEQMCLVLKIKD